MIEFQDEDSLNEYIAKQSRMGEFDWEVEDRYENLNLYSDLYFHSENDLNEFIEVEIGNGEWDGAVAKRAEKIDKLPVPPYVDRMLQSNHRFIHPKGVYHWTFCTDCLERYK